MHPLAHDAQVLFAEQSHGAGVKPVFFYQHAFRQRPPNQTAAQVGHSFKILVGKHGGQEKVRLPDGNPDVARYPAPRSSRRLYDAQAYPQQQQYYDNRGSAPQYGAPQVYAPRPYYQPRGLSTYQD